MAQNSRREVVVGRKRERVDGWPGYIHRQQDGRPVFVIEKQIGLTRFHVSTRAHTITAAVEQLKRFEANPEAYEPKGSIGYQVRMTADLCIDFRRWQRDVKRVTPRHAHFTAKYLADWIKDIGNRDLRALTSQELRELVARRLSGGHRIAALKAFFGWLRTEKGLVRHHQDATLDLKVPQARPEKYRRRKALDWETVEAVLPHLDQATADCVQVFCATGWHLTELERFAKRGELHTINGGVVAVTPHKGGDLARTALRNAAQVAAAKRLRAKGCLPRKIYQRFQRASEKAGLPREKWVTPGAFRHSVATWACEDGATIESVSRFLGHKDPRTTARFYVDLRAPVEAIPVRVPQVATSRSKSSRKRKASSSELSRTGLRRRL